MQIIPKIDEIKGRTLSDDTKSTDKIIEANILVGEDSDPLNIRADWQIVNMEKRSLELQLNFEKPLYISTA